MRGQADHDRLEFTRGVINEALRLYPPIYFVTREPKDDVDLGGFRIPAGSVLLLSFYGQHRALERFPDPDSFVPDRWLDPTGSKVEPLSFMPFNIGLHACIGERLAMTELVTVLAEIVKRWRLVPVSASDPRPVGWATLAPGPVPMTLHARPEARATAPEAAPHVPGAEPTCPYA